MKRKFILCKFSSWNLRKWFQNFYFIVQNVVQEVFFLRSHNNIVSVGRLFDFILQVLNILWFSRLRILFLFKHHHDRHHFKFIFQFMLFFLFSNEIILWVALHGIWWNVDFNFFLSEMLLLFHNIKVHNSLRVLYISIICSQLENVFIMKTGAAGSSWFSVLNYVEKVWRFYWIIWIICAARHCSSL